MRTLELETMVAGAVTVGLRVSGILVFAPFLGSSSIVPRIKGGLVLALTLLLYPVCGRPLDFAAPWSWLHVVVGETSLGLLIGLAANLVFEAAQMAGNILGVQMGYSLVNLIDPQTQVETPVLALFHQTIALLIFLHLNVHHWLLRAVTHSYAYLPAGSAFPTGLSAGALLQAAGSIWLVGVQIAAPALAATMMADFALAFLGKASPQLPIMIIGISVKSMLGMLALIGSLAYWPRLFENQFTRSIELCERMLRLAH
jgi:flagellar biosynthetic protein FliR